MTLLEIVLVIVVIVLLIAVLLPSLSGHHVLPRRIACAANLHALGSALATNAGGNDEVIADQLATASGGATDFNDPAGQKPNVFSAITRGMSPTPYKFMYCPSSTPWSAGGALKPTPLSNTSYVFNGVACGIPESKIIKPSAFVLVQESLYQTNTCFLRPYANAAGDYVYWSQRDAANDAASQLGATHSGQGNILYADFHVDTKKIGDVRPEDFGLIPGGAIAGAAGDIWSDAVGPGNTWSKTYVSGLPK